MSSGTFVESGEESNASRSGPKAPPSAWWRPSAWRRIVDARRQIGEIARTASFRMAAAFGGAFAFSSLLLFAFIYWQTAVFETQRVDRLLVDDAAAFAREPGFELLRSVNLRLAKDLHRIAFAALFDADGKLVIGNLPALPPGLPVDGMAHGTRIRHATENGVQTEDVRAVARRLPQGRILVVGRNIDALVELRHVVVRALALGVIPSVLLALVVGISISLRALERVRRVSETAERIMRGDLHERLPSRGTDDDFDRLSAIVNQMLDEIERLLDEVKGIGDDIAHDLRTPLTRVRIKLERGRAAAASHEALRAAVDTAILGLDQTLGVIAALLRISEIEAGRRRAGFAPLGLASLAAEVADLYAPIAEERGIALQLEAAQVPPVLGDRDMLIEALSNLVGNAIKFTPTGGAIVLEVTPAGAAGTVALAVADNGPGIAPEEREAVLKRFYRSDKSRHVDGTGLGLSLVAAIAKLHRFTLTIGDAHPGCRVALLCPVHAPSDAT
jgi:signal transduction histidine kinase